MIIRTILQISTCMHERLWGHLLRGGREQAAFILAHVERNPNGVRMVGRQGYLVPPEDFQNHSWYHVALTDEAQQRILQSAWTAGCALVELHAHLGSWPAAFSATDMEGLLEFAPHAAWRLRQPYLALVVTPNGFDALFWASKDASPGALEEMRVDDQVFRPTGRTFTAMEKMASE